MKLCAEMKIRDSTLEASLWLGVVMVTMLPLTMSHLVLTFPQPRKYDLDSLDNVTSSEPCGMPKGPVKTTLQSGKPFNITWKLAYPHLGGYRLQLMDSLARPLLDLTPVTSESEFITVDSTTDFLTVTIPSEFECENCTIRLVRESREWQEKNWYWSCADVDIKTKKTYKETCSGHGRYLLSKCRCDRFFYGEHCQYKDECIEQTDCGEMGRCVDLDTSSYPHKQCYCELGWFGPKCDKRSPVKTTKLDLSGHMHKELSEELQLYWRLMEEEGEIEVVLVGQGTSYIGIGWRPNSTDETCRNFPVSNNNSTDAEAGLMNPLHPMECTDMVIGTARGSSFRIRDYYSKDRSTPHLDTYWGGKNDLTAAMGFEKDGITTIVFRKKIKATEPTDHPILDEDMHVIWARGQSASNYDHGPDFVLKNNTDLQDFYKDDDLKYHGHKNHRGLTYLNFYEQIVEKSSKEANSTQLPASLSCKGSWRHPKNCDPAKLECEYMAQWVYSSPNDLIHFTISTKNTELWTGIAFSKDHKMAQSDAIIGLVDKSGRAFVMDTWIVGRTVPFLDSSQDISNTSAKTVDGITTLSFDRKRVTGDTRDLAFTDDECLYMMYPVKGGEFNAVNKKIRQHQITPSISASKVCIRSCALGEGDPNYQEHAITYLLGIKLASLGPDFVAPKPGTKEFDSLSQSVNSAFQKLLMRYKTVTYEVKEFKQSENDVITELQLHLKDSSMDASVRKTLRQAVAKGAVGTILLDTNYFTLAQLEDKSIDNSLGFERGKILTAVLESWIVIGCLAALIILIVVQAGCTIFSRKKPKPDQKSTAWKDYSSGGIHYDAEPEEKIPGTLRPAYHPSQKISALPYIQYNPKMSHPGGNNNYNDTKSLQRMKAHVYPMDRNTHSLPRAPHPVDVQNGNYYTHRPLKQPKNGKDQVQPDFYFMPSQRKYSGEVVRVYVDYDKQGK